MIVICDTSSISNLLQVGLIEALPATILASAWFVAGLGSTMVTTVPSPIASGTMQSAGTAIGGFGFPGTGLPFSAFTLLPFFFSREAGEHIYKLR